MTRPHGLPLRMHRRRRAGITLLEVMLTIAVLTVVALSAVLLLVPIAGQTRVTREVHLANTEAQRALEGVLATPFHEITTEYPPGAAFAVDTLPEGQIVVNYPDPLSDPLEVHVTLSWSSTSLGDMQRTFVTVRTE